MVLVRRIHRLTKETWAEMGRKVKNWKGIFLGCRILELASKDLNSNQMKTKIKDRGFEIHEKVLKSQIKGF
jgi:hypothetical protein